MAQSMEPLGSTAERSAFRRTVLFLALPIIGRNLVDALVTSTDMLLLGSVNQNAMAAVGLAGNVQFVLSLFMFGLATGSSLLASQYWGRGDVRTIERIFGIALRFSLSASLLFVAAALCAPQLLMGIFTEDPALIADGVAYLRIVGITYLMTGFTEMYLNINRSMERVRLAPVVYFISFLVSLSLNLYFLFVLKLGVMGVAMAAVAARTVECSICVAAAARNQRFRVRISDIFAKHGPLLQDFVRYSLPAIGNDVVWGVGFTMYSVIIGHLSTDAVAAYSIVGIARKLTMVVCYAMSSVAAVVVGKALGADRMDHAKRYASRMLKTTLVAGLVGGALLWAMTPVFMNIAKLTEAAQGYLHTMLRINIYYVLGQAVNTMLVCGIFRPGGDTRFGFLCDTVNLWVVAIPIGALCAFVFKLPVMWVYFVLYLDEFIKMPFLFRHYRKGHWLRNITREMT